MLYHSGIHLDSANDLNTVAADVGRVLGLPLASRSDDGDIWYEHADAEVYETLGQNTLEGSPALPLGSYRYHLALWPRRGSTPDETERLWREEKAPALFQRLRATGRYPLLLIEGVQTKLAEYHPAAAAAR